MTKFKGTSGNWRLSSEKTSGRQMIDLGDFKGSIDVWYHNGDNMTKEEAIANATLIVGAKDLLGVCLQALEMCKEKVMPTENDLTIMAGRLKQAIDNAIS